MKLYRGTIFVFVVLFCSIAFAQDSRAPKVTVKKAELGKTVNVHAADSVYLAGQPTPDDIDVIKKKGIKRVITLRTDGEVNWDEEAAFKQAGIEFIKIPFSAPDTLTDEVFDKARKLLAEKKKKPTLLHCGSANRVGAVWLAHRVLDDGLPIDAAIKEAKTVGLRTPGYLQKALDYVQRKAKEKPQTDEQSVRPGINDSFLDPELDVQEWLGRFEIESREVFANREAIVDAIGIRAGDHVADVGAGTGFFSRMFAEATGETGWVYAVDISPRLLSHIVERAEADSLTNLTAVLAPQKSITLPPDSIDVAFVCDTYHHFEFPQATLRSIHRALRPGGTLVVIDFDRVPGKSREFVINHVRAGKDVFRSEIESAGFRFVGESDIEGLKENYFLRFRVPTETN